MGNQEAERAISEVHIGIRIIPIIYGYIRLYRLYTIIYDYKAIKQLPFIKTLLCIKDSVRYLTNVT